MALPTTLTDQLNAAETALEAAQATDAAQAVTAQTLVDATTADTAAKGNQLTAHQASTQAANDFVAAVKGYFGI